MAFTKKQKTEMMAQYETWIKSSQAMFAMSYTKMSMKDIDALRAKARESGSEMHIVKNTLMIKALEKAGISKQEFLEGTTMVGFAFNDPPALAKVLSDATKNSEIFALKGGFLGAEVINPAQVKALADLPPLPVMRAKLLGLLNAPASQLVRTLAEPGRGLACVVKAYADKAAPAAA